MNLTAGFGDQFGDIPNNHPGTYRSFSEVNYFGRLSTYFDLTPDWQLEAGVSGLINPNTGEVWAAFWCNPTASARSLKKRAGWLALI